MKWTTDKPVDSGHYWYKTRDIARDSGFDPDDITTMPLIDREADAHVLRVEKNLDSSMVYQDKPRYEWKSLDKLRGTSKFIAWWSDCAVETPESVN